jgi:hypothetical protein
LSSVLLSSAEVASSSTIIFGFLRKSLAIFSLCLSHPESLSHLSQIIVSSHLSKVNTKSASAFFRAFSISFFVAFFLAYLRFSKIVVLKILLSCITSHIFFLNDALFISKIFFPSRKISPEEISQKRKSKLTIVLFPAPVFQTKATFSQGFIEKFIFFNTLFPSI